MAKLDNFKKIKVLDRSSVLEAASLFPDQINQTWEEVSRLEFLSPPAEIKNIIVVGMGGSALGARIIDSLSFEVLKVPLEIVNGYHLPAYVGKNSLVLISSYSGNTEETLSGYQEARKKAGSVFLITTNGKLAKWAKKDHQPAYVFKAPFNPSGQPRLGVGYSVAAQLAVLSYYRLIRVEKSQISQVINDLEDLKEKLGLATPVKQNPAKKMAKCLQGKIIVLVSSEHLNGATHAFKNMLNENSKVFSTRFSLPEMNHHLLEGLAFPKENKKILKFLFIDSSIYDPEIKKRLKVTQEVVAKNRVDLEVLKIKSRTRLGQVLELVMFGEFTSAYLGFLNGLDPAPIPWVDFFKERLSK